MKKANRYRLILLVIIAQACTSTSNESTSDEGATTSAEAKATELTYRDLIRIVFDDEGEGIEWHGEESPNELKDLLTITAGGPCGEGDCGNALYLVNTSEQTINAVIKGDFDIEGTQSYITRKYNIAGGDTLKMGCSHLCSDGEAYAFPRTIVASEYESTE